MSMLQATVLPLASRENVGSILLIFQTVNSFILGCSTLLRGCRDGMVGI